MTENIKIARPKSVLAKRKMGREAFLNRQPLSANPCGVWNEREEWAIGWIEERDLFIAAYLDGKK